MACRSPQITWAQAVSFMRDPGQPDWAVISVCDQATVKQLYAACADALFSTICALCCVSMNGCV